MTVEYAIVPQSVVVAVEKAREYAAIEVKDAATYAVAGDYLKAIKGWASDATDHRLSLTRPLDEQKADIMARFRPAIDALGNAESDLKRSMTAFHVADQRAKAEAERILREQQEAEAARLRAESEAAADAGDLDTAIERNYQAEFASAPIVAPQAAKVSGISFRETWSAEVTNFVELIKAAAKNPQAYAQYLQPNTTALGSAVRSQKDAFNVPGVTAHKSESMAAGRR